MKKVTIIIESSDVSKLAEAIARFAEYLRLKLTTVEEITISWEDQEPKEEAHKG